VENDHTVGVEEGKGTEIGEKESQKGGLSRPRKDPKIEIHQGMKKRGEKDPNEAREKSGKKGKHEKEKKRRQQGKTVFLKKYVIQTPAFKQGRKGAPQKKKKPRKTKKARSAEEVSENG